jgi:group I intron endonuclease
LTRTTFIYALHCPTTNKIRYVGKSDNPEKRLYRHIADAKKSTKCHRLAWIKSLLDLNLKPTISILEEVDVDTWGEKETYWINQFDNLTNMIDGGKFCPMYNPEIIAKMKQTKKENPQKFSENARKKLSDATKRRWKHGGLKPRKFTTDDKVNASNRAKEIWATMNSDDKSSLCKKISLGRQKSILQLDLNYNIINSFSSVNEASIHLGYKRSCSKICVACKTGILFKNFYWKYLI